MKVGDLVIPWENRVTSNAVNIKNIKLAKVIEPPKRLSSWDTKSSMVIEILDGYAISKNEGRGKSSYGKYSMPQSWGRHHHSKGAKIVVYQDGFRISTASYVATHETIDTGKGLVSDNNINPHVLMCMLQ